MPGLEGDFVGAFDAASGPAKLKRPVGLAVNRDGRICVADEVLNAVYEYAPRTPTGPAVRTVSGSIC